MFLLALIYLIILIAHISFSLSGSERWGRFSGLAQWVLFAIIGFVLFWNVLNK